MERPKVFLHAYEGAVLGPTERFFHVTVYFEEADRQNYALHLGLERITIESKKSADREDFG